MNTMKIILGLIPFALFAFLATVIDVGWAALIGALAALVSTAVDARGGIRLIPAAGVVILGMFAVLGFTTDPGFQAVLAGYGRGLATLLLAIVMLCSVPIAPFTTTYAKATVAPSQWHSDRFVAANRSISLAWGLAVLAMAVGHLAASALDAAGVTIPVVNAALNWGLPVVAIVMTVKYTRRTAGVAPQSAPA